MSLDLQCMQRALTLAEKGALTARPNPLVGCVVAQEGQIVGEGTHWQAGRPHAECEALSIAGARAKKGTLYVTLEPCVHRGRTGPCVSRIVEAGIAKVVIATEDPNPLVRGKGIAALEAHGLSVSVGLFRQEAQALNKGFFSRMIRERPYVRAKVAMSLDGRMSMANGESQWITGKEARLAGHYLRAQSGAIVTTGRTVCQDDCRLTVRHLPSELPQDLVFQQPLRVVLDRQLQTTPFAHIYQEPGDIVIACGETVPSALQDRWLAAMPQGHTVRFKRLPEPEGKLDMAVLCEELAKEAEVNDLLIEAGGILVGSLLEARLIDELWVFIAPKLLGCDAKSLHVPGLCHLRDHIPGRLLQVKQVGTEGCLVLAFSDFLREPYGNTLY